MDIDKPPSKLSRALYRSPIPLYRAGLGWLMPGRLLMLTHVGRRSGEYRFAVLEVVRADPEAFLVPAAYGPRADWYRNLEKTPTARVNHKGKVYDVAAERLSEAEATQEFTTYAATYPKAAANLGRVMGLSFEDPAGVAGRIPLMRLVVR